MTRINNVNDMIKAAGGYDNILNVYALSNSLCLHVKDSRKMNYLVVLNSKHVENLVHISENVYMIRMDYKAYDLAEDITRLLDAQKAHAA